MGRRRCCSWTYPTKDRLDENRVPPARLVNEAATFEGLDARCAIGRKETSAGSSAAWRVTSAVIRAEHRCGWFEVGFAVIPAAVAGCHSGLAGAALVPAAPEEGEGEWFWPWPARSVSEMGRRKKRLLPPPSSPPITITPPANRAGGRPSWDQIKYSPSPSKRRKKGRTLSQKGSNLSLNKQPTLWVRAWMSRHKWEP
jgi:hypothetical protein